MKNFELLLISLALAMDAFSVSICKGLSLKHNFKKNSIIIALSFSLFQMLMPILGYFLGSTLNSFFLKFNHIIAFSLLSVIGFNMIKESYHDEKVSDNLNIKELIFLSIATSIDAMAVGITFSLFKINLMVAIFLIGICCFILSLIGVNIGKLIGKNFNKKAQVIGGIVLILMGLKFLLEHFNIF